MRITKKIFALILVVFMVAGSLVSCQKKPDSSRTLYAVYDGSKFIYADDTDFMDFLWTNIYSFAIENGGRQLTSEEYSSMITRSIKSTLVMRTLEKRLKKAGYSVDEDKIRLAAVSDAENFEKNYEGGYEKFLSEWNLSKNALFMVNKYQAMIDLAAEKLSDYKPATDEEANEYYLDNSINYYEPPAYQLYSLVLQVSDPSDSAKKAEVLSDAKAYIERLRAGESWDKVKESAFIKYNEENGCPYSYFLTGKESVSLLDFKKIEDLDAEIAKIDADFKEKNKVSFKEMFPDGFYEYAKKNSLEKDSADWNKAFEIFFDYSAAVYLAQYNYIIGNSFKEGETYSEPLYHDGFGCYVIFTFDKIKEEASFTPFEEVKKDIIEKLNKDKLNAAADKYIEDLCKELELTLTNFS